MLGRGVTGQELMARGLPRKLVYEARRELIEVHGLMASCELADILGLSTDTLLTLVQARGMGKVLGRQTYLTLQECDVLVDLYTIPEGYVHIKTLGWSAYRFFARLEHRQHRKWCLNGRGAAAWYISPAGQLAYQNRRTIRRTR
ncbi:hypothetical protein DC3_15240 [Deinococcus cellulosilyticus NBRC 106333 = KACC 11606]|uniref:Uncharacterized protein n=2 Tax=Deinococcus cellulosilyticus TaxID=401558 RepID=A0A511MZB7_DEIC1|nr:hypothetical protein DC3_15240 [Deinococcus cellulosilyticus NBRC 106333 = KACC 11606]